MKPIFRTSPGASVADPSLPHTILVGLPGAGKSTVGAAVAELLQRGFLDFDIEIERREASPVSVIFAERGELYFRRRELALTEELREVGNMILSPGGGWITNPEVVGLLRPPSRLIYLHVSPETAIERMGASDSSRPLLQRGQPIHVLRELLIQREPLYRAADHIVDTELFDLQEVINRVARLAQGSGPRYVTP